MAAIDEPLAAGKSSASGGVCFITASMPVCRRERNIFRAVGLVAGAILLEIHLIGDVELRLPVLDGAGERCARLYLRRSVKRLDRRVRARAMPARR